MTFYGGMSMRQVWKRGETKQTLRARFARHKVEHAAYRFTFGKTARLKPVV
jgi:hypothetical protein